MTPERYQRVKELFFEACERQPNEVADLLDRACAGDPSLRPEVELLLAHDGQTSTSARGSSGQLWDGTVAQTSRGTVGQQRDTLTGKRIGKYEVRGVIGRGGMGTVYEAVQERPHRVVALKLMRRELASPSARRRFEYEAEILGRLKHPGIAQIFEAGVDQGPDGSQPFFAMEYVKGQRLTEYADTNKLDIRQRLLLMAKICDAIQHAHQQGVIHRDLKPGNILVDECGQPKVLDFGIARTTDADLQASTLLTDVGQLVGTLAYMSPEQIAGDAAGVDTRSDVYALGVVCYELLAGRLPYEARQGSIAEIVELARVIRDENPIPLSSVDRSFRGDIDIIVTKALEKKKDRRYASANGLALDIRRYLNDEPIAARTPTVAYHLRKLASRHRSIAGGGAVALVTLVVASGLSLISASQARRQERNAQEAARREYAVRDGLVRMLLASHPLELGPDAKLRDLLDWASKNVIPTLSGDRDTYVELKLILGQAYRDILQFDPAEEQIKEAIARIEADLSGEGETLARCFRAIAAVMRAKGPRDSEVAYLQQALNFDRDHMPTSRSDFINDSHTLGMAMFDLVRFADAETYFSDAVAEARKLSKDPGIELANALSALAACKAETGRLAEAEPLYKEAYAIAEELTGRPGVDHADLLMNLAAWKTREGDFDVARELYHRLISDLQAHLGEGDPALVRVRRADGGVLFSTGRYKEAEEIFRALVETTERLLGENHSETIASVNSLGVCLRDLGRLHEAEHCLQTALRRAQANSRISPRGIANFQINLARCLLRKGQLDEAEELTDASLEVRRRFWHRHPDVAEGLLVIGLVRFEQGDYESSESCLREADEMYRSCLPDDHRDVAQAESALGMCLRARGDVEEAEACLLSSHQKLLENVGPSHRGTMDAYERLVEFYEHPQSEAPTEVRWVDRSQGGRNQKR